METEELKDMLFKHDKHIDRLDLSFTMIADNLKDNNTKLDKLIEVVENQRIFTSELHNLRENTNESLKRGFKRIESLEKANKEQINPTALKWLLVAIITYSISFAIFVDSSIHLIDSKCVQLTEQIRK